MKKFVEEFKSFILRGSVVDLAVGVLIGSAFQGLVTSLTENIISPILGMFGETDFSGFVLRINFWIIHLNIRWGAFLTDVINFVIMAFIIFLIVKMVNKLKDSTINRKKKNEEEEKKEEPKKDENILLLEEIRDLLKKESKKK